MLPDGPDPLPFRYFADRFSDADGLLRAVEAGVAWDVQMRARQTASMGRPYDYSQMRYPARPFLAEIAALLPVIAEVCGFLPDNCLLNRYPDGSATMGWHRDERRGMAPESGVAILSLGAPRTLGFRTFPGRLPGPEARPGHGSLLLLPADSLDRWQHRIAPEPGAGARISLTFRRLQSDTESP